MPIVAVAPATALSTSPTRMFSRLLLAFFFSGWTLVVFGQNEDPKSQFRAELAAADKRVKAAEAEVAAAEQAIQNASADQVHLAQERAKRERAYNERKAILEASRDSLARLMRRGDRELPSVKAMISRAEAEVSAHESTLELLGERYQQSIEALQPAVDRIAALEEPRTAALDELAEALAERIALLESTHARFAHLMPPILSEVKVFSGPRLMYHGRWIPKATELDGRIKTLKTLIEEAPKAVAKRGNDVRQLIDEAAAAIKKTDAAMDTYFEQVLAEDHARSAMEFLESVQTVGRDALAGGYVGLVISGLGEAYKLHNYIAESREYWKNNSDILSIGASSTFRAETSEELVALANQRNWTKSIEEAYLARKDTPDAGVINPTMDDLKEKRDRAPAPLANNPDATAVKAEAWTTANRLAGELDSSLAWAELSTAVTDLTKRVANSPFAYRDSDSASDFLYKALIDRTRGEATDRAVEFRKFLSSANANFFGGLLTDTLVTAVKDATQQQLMRARIKSYMDYVDAWVYQVWCENEVIQTAFDALYLRRLRIAALRKLDRLTGMRNGGVDDRRALDVVTNHTLSGNGAFRLELYFSKPVAVDNVRVADKPVEGRGSETTWTGSFDLTQLSRWSEIAVEAHEELSGHRLDNPYRIPYWSYLKGTWDNGYSPQTDMHHHVDIESVEKGTAIAIVLDTSGSMAENGKIDRGISFVRSVVRANSASENEFGLFIYSDCSVDHVVRFGTDRKAIDTTLANVVADGNTPLSKSIRVATDALLRDTNKGDVRLIIVSDGKDSCTPDDLAPALAYARERLGAARVVDQGTQ